MTLHRLENFPDLKDGRCNIMQSHDGLSIRVATWGPTTGAPKGTICLLQGRAEFIEKYYEVINDLRQRGFAVALMDWRGQGGSERLVADPLKGHVRSFDNYGKDLKAFIHQYVLPDCPPPHFALAHSMGALILLKTLPELRTIFDRALLCAPLVELAQEQRRLFGKNLRHSTVRRMSGLMRMLGMGGRYVLGAERSPLDRMGFDVNPLTSDGPRYDRNRSYVEDFPELGLAGPTNAWINECCKAIRLLKDSDFVTQIHTPILVVTASRDRIVSSDAAEYFARTLRCGHAVSVAGARHEIMMERDLLREQFWAAFEAFIPGNGDKFEISQ